MDGSLVGKRVGGEDDEEYTGGNRVEEYSKNGNEITSSGSC